MDTIFNDYLLEEAAILANTDPSECFCEGAVYNVLNDITGFIQKLINDLISFAKKVKNDISSFIEKKQVRMKLKKLKKDLQEKKSLGVRKVEMVDVNQYISIYESYEKTITKKLKVLSKGNFKNREKMMAVAKNIENNLDDMETDLDYLLSHKIAVPIKKAIQYVEENLTGKSRVELAFVEASHKLKDVIIEVERVMKDQSLRSDENFEKEYAGVVKRTVSKATHKLSRGMHKFMFGVVAVFA